MLEAVFRGVKLGTYFVGDAWKQLRLSMGVWIGQWNAGK